MIKTIIRKIRRLTNPKLRLAGFCATVKATAVSMPPGYKLITDGTKFKFVNIGNGFDSSAYGTAEYAAKLAWHVYESMKRDEDSKGKWKDA